MPEIDSAPCEHMQVPLTPLRFLDRSAKLYTDKTALICGEHNISYGQFRDRVNRAANLFSTFESDDEHPPRIAFLTWNCHLVVEASFATYRARVIRVPVNVRLSPADWSFIINKVRATAVVVDLDFLDKFDTIRSGLKTVKHFYQLGTGDNIDNHNGYDDYAAAVASQSVQWPEPPYQYRPETEPVEIFFTSGTTGSPKGVQMNTRNLYQNAVDFFLPFGLSQKDIFLHALSQFHINGWGTLHAMAACGGTQVIMRQFSPAEFCRLVHKHGVTLSAMVPTMLNLLVQYPDLDKSDLGSLRLIESGGAKLPVALGYEAKRKLGCRIMASYGLTETAPVVTFAQDILDREGVAELEDDVYHRQVFGPGIESLDCAHMVVDEHGNEVARDGKHVGEVLVRGNIVTDGYWSNPEANTETFTENEPKWLRTGDLAVVDADGYTHIVDRKKDLIIRGGENISSLEVEDVLRTHPSVLEAAVIPIPSEKWGEDPLAVVVVIPLAVKDAEAILDHCRKNLAGFKVPARVEFIDELPKSGTGKILKRELRKLFDK